MTDISLDLFNAYFAARQNKRNTYNQLKFEYSYESNLLLLNDEIINRKYVPLPEMAFIVNKPVKREIFAADFTPLDFFYYFCTYVLLCICII